MTISVIIPTYNGAKKLPNILNALAQQTYQDFETIVVIDGSTDNTIEMLEKENHWNLKDFKFIFQENGGRSKVRNFGAKNAKGELLIFFDDDTRPQKDSIERHKNHYQKFQKTILVGNPPIQKEKTISYFDKYRCYLNYIWVKDLSPSPFRIQTPFFTAANCSIPTEIFKKLRGFDENLTDAEDFDMAMRAFELNIPLYFDIDNIAWHDDFVSCKKYIQRLRQYNQSHEYLSKLKPELLKKYPIYIPAELNWKKKIVYSFFGNHFFVDLIDNNSLFFKILPTFLRYKIYDYVITSLSKYYNNRKLD